MFIIISSLNETPLLSSVSSLIESTNNPTLETYIYGISSALAANLVNNVPMSLLYGDILNYSSIIDLNSVYATILSSNLCALITPCGALSSLMFIRICKENDEKISYLTYFKYAPIGLILLVIGISLIFLF